MKCPVNHFIEDQLPLCHSVTHGALDNLSAGRLHSRVLDSQSASFDSSNLARVRQAAVTVAFGHHAEILDRTFTSFAQNKFLELHAIILGHSLPNRQIPGIQYHLVPHDTSFGHALREVYYRRWELLDMLGVDYAVVVDNHDVLCLRSIPELPCLLRGASLGACPEHGGGKYIAGQGYTSAYFNAGVTFWNVQASRPLRQEIVRRARRRFRSVDDQLVLNEVAHTRFFDEVIILPSQYNYRPCLAPTRIPNWPTVDHLDGVRIYHNVYSLEAARALLPVKDNAFLPPVTAA
ncbi:MAG: hypothetical protein QHJ82_03880 [Verrucomicrobiota bacterium]|nr:hypothetical protein [Verrucomicrobiota bacterium]